MLLSNLIWNIFMNNRVRPEVDAIISRNKLKKAVWKSFVEFQEYFSASDNITPMGSFSPEQMEILLKENDDEINKFKQYVNSFQSINGYTSHFDLVVNKINLTYIEHNSIMIYINNKLYSFDAIFSDLYKKWRYLYSFYLYCSKDGKNKLSKNNYKYKSELIEYIKQYEQFRLSPC